MATVFTSGGEDFIVDVLDGTLSVPTYYIGYGTGAGEATATDISLSVEVTNRAATVNSQPVGDTNRFVATLTAQAAATLISEAGLFTSSVAGTLLSRSKFSTVDLTTSAEVIITFDLKQG